MKADRHCTVLIFNFFQVPGGGYGSINKSRLKVFSLFVCSFVRLFFTYLLPLPLLHFFLLCPVSLVFHLKVDLEYLTNVCMLCRVAGVDHFSLISSQGASATSPLLYSKTKGQGEKVGGSTWATRICCVRAESDVQHLLFVITLDRRQGLKDDTHLLYVHCMCPEICFLPSH